VNRKLKIITSLLLTAVFAAVFASCSKGPRAIKTPGGYRIETFIPKGTLLMGISDGSAVGIGGGSRIYFAQGPKDRWAIKTPGGYSIETVLIPKGTFLMGSSDGSSVGIGVPGTDPDATPAEPGRESYETQHRVTLSKDYYMSKYPITNAQYAGFLNHAGVDATGAKTGIQGGKTLIMASVYFNDYNDYCDWGLHYNGNRWEPVGYKNHPVMKVSWYGAKAYAEWAGGDLPTEAQWERAARGGVENRPFGIGDGKRLTGDMANFTDIYADCTTAVGAYSGYANAYGLYDMHGNVYEWCLDRWDRNSNYANLPSTDPVGTTGSDRVLRGGGWNGGWDVGIAQYCRSASRFSGHPDRCGGYVGFRVVFYP
jgi:formylglycine-generating enzyme required for sulfatase activity